MKISTKLVKTMMLLCLISSVVFAQQAINYSKVSSKTSTKMFNLPIGSDRANPVVSDQVASDKILPSASIKAVSDLSEGFEDITLLEGLGWAMINNSQPIGVTSWFQGNITTFPAQAGTETSYIGANFNNTAGTGTISNWLLTPETELNDGDVISFWTRCPTGSTWPDRLELRLSLNGPSTNVGTTATDVGDFTTLLLSVNPDLTVGGYPEEWTEFTATLSGIGMASGRIGFRYFVTGGGPNGANSNYIGIDTYEYSSAPSNAIFSDDFESGITNWAVTGTWGITDQYSYSTSHSLTDSPGGNYIANQETYATMANGVDLSDPAILSVDLSWWMIMDIENGNFDYLYVEVSDDNFATFVEIASFFGEDMLDPWVEYSYPLGVFLGSNNVKVRFHFSSDGGYEVDGCYIDDVTITTSDVDNAAPEIFFDAPFAYEGTVNEYLVEAELIDATGVASAEVIYTVDGVPQSNITGVNVGGNNWEFTIPQQDPGYQVDFVITATDASPNANEAITDTARYIAGQYIGYDNAVVDFYTSIAAPGGTAVVFELANPSQLVTALIRNYTDQSQPPNDEMLVHIWSDGGNGPGVDLIDPIPMMPEANLVNTRAFTRVDLRPYAAQLSNIVGNVFVGYTVPSGIVLTTITQPGIGNHSFNSLDGSTWNALADDYHYRIIVDPGTTGIEDVVSNSTSIYPNPASAVVNIKSDYTINTIKVYSYSGQVISSELADSKFYQINTSKFTSGLYMFQIETNEGTITKRIIIE